MTLSGDSEGRRDRDADRNQPRGFGIRAKLFIAFFAFASLTVVACAIAWIAFTTIDRSVTRVTQDSVPGMAAALALAKIVAEISATAPALVSSVNQPELAAEKATLDAHIERFSEVSISLGGVGDYDEIADELINQLDTLSVAVERRLDIKRRRENRVVDVRNVHGLFTETLEPMVDDAVFDLVIDGEAVMAENTASITSLVDDGVAEIDYLLSISASVNLAAGLLAEAINVTDPIALEPISERFRTAALETRRNLAQLPKNRKTEALRRVSNGLLVLGESRDKVFDRVAGPVIEGAGSLLTPESITDQLKERHNQVRLVLTPMIDDAAFALVMTTEDMTARSETAISGLIDGNAGTMSTVLTAQAEGNLVASLLGEAAVAENESLLGPLFDRFLAAEERLTTLLMRVEGATFHNTLAKTTDALLDLGRGEGGMFALRQAELDDLATSQAALDVSRNLSLQLGGRVSEIVARAEVESREASARSTGAIDTGQIVLLLITAIGLAGAAVVMFRYVDPRIIRPIGDTTAVMTKLAAGDTGVDIPGRDRPDEIGDMARALGVFRDTAISVQEANMKEIQTTRRRLAEAIESISEGFSLYDSEDRLVISNIRYRELLFPGMSEAEMPIAGLTFEELLRRVVAAGLVSDAGDDTETWIATRLAQHKEPGSSHVQLRSDGRYVMVSERSTDDGGTVAVYSDITEMKLREAELSQKSNELEQLAGQLAKYLSPQVYESIFTGRQEVKLASQRKKLTIFFSDIVEFTSTAEKLQPEDLTLLLNEYLTEMSSIALRHGATIDKYVGDAIVIFFGDPESRGVQQDALSCVEMAIEMREKMDELRLHWRDRGIEKPVEIRIGINTGFCTVGNFGSEARMDYTIIGAGVNLAARLETAANPSDILISYETHALVRDHIACEARDPVTVKGVSQPVATFRVVDSIENVGEDGHALREDHRNLRLEMNPAAMSQGERDKAEAALREALDRLAPGQPDDGTGDR